MMDRENYEITTLRIDKVTDGRHAGLKNVHLSSEQVLDQFKLVFLGLVGLNRS